MACLSNKQCKWQKNHDVNEHWWLCFQDCSLLCHVETTLRGIVTLKQGCTCSFIVVQQQLTSECANHGLLSALPWLHIMPYRRLDSMGPVNFMIVLSSLDIYGLKFQWMIVVFLPVYVRRLSSDLGFPSLNLNGELWWNIFFLFISCYQLVDT